jgi:hypothetical protein
MFAIRMHRKSLGPTILGVLTLASLGPLLLWDASPTLFPARAHDVLAATPLTLVAVAYLVYQITRRANARDFAKALLSAVAFIFWALNQLLPNHPRATLFNDIAITAFVLDIVLLMVGSPGAGLNESDRALPDPDPKRLAQARTRG